MPGAPSSVLVRGLGFAVDIDIEQKASLISANDWFGQAAQAARHCKSVEPKVLATFSSSSDESRRGLRLTLTWSWREILELPRLHKLIQTFLKSMQHGKGDSC